MRAWMLIISILALGLALAMNGQPASTEPFLSGSQTLVSPVRVLGVLVDGKPVPADIRPEECPNIINVHSHGKIPLALVGVDGDFDAVEVNPLTVRLAGALPIEGSESWEDVTSPWVSEDDLYTGKDDPRDCVVWDDEAPPLDGVIDFKIKFETQVVVDAIEGYLGDRGLLDGEVLVLGITGNLTDGTAFYGEDVVVVKNKKKQKDDKEPEDG